MRTAERIVTKFGFQQLRETNGNICNFCPDLTQEQMPYKVTNTVTHIFRITYRTITGQQNIANKSFR
jgi:hypothetical protein